MWRLGSVEMGAVSGEKKKRKDEWGGVAAEAGGCSPLERKI